MTQKAMTEEQLLAIEVRASRARGGAWYPKGNSIYAKIAADEDVPALVAEVRRLAAADFDRSTREHDLEAEVRRLRAFVQRHQWNSTSGCLECDAREEDGHLPDCELVALLGREPK